MSDIMKKVTFLLRRGLKKDLPNLLEGEVGLTTDTKELYVGTSDGSMQMAKQDDVDQGLNRLDDKIGILQEKSFGLKDKGAKGDGISDDTLKLQQLLDSATKGGLITSPAGMTYKITAPLTVKYSNTIIDFNGSKIVYAGTQSLGGGNGASRLYGAININGSFGNNAEVTISSVASNYQLPIVNDENTWSSSTLATTSCMKITTTLTEASAQFSVGDYLYIYAQNFKGWKTWNTSYADNPSMISEVARIVKVSGADVIVDTNPDFVFDSSNFNGIVRKFDPIKNVTVKNLVFEDINETVVPTSPTNSERESWVGGIRSSLAVNTKIENFECSRHRFPAVALDRVYNPKVVDLNAYSPRAISAGCGYGIQNGGCSHGSFYKLRGLNLRHLIDFSSGGHHYVEDAKMPNGEKATFDCHGMGEHDITFNYCIGNVALGNGNVEFPEMTTDIKLNNFVGGIDSDWTKSLVITNSKINLLEARRTNRFPIFKAINTEIRGLETRLYMNATSRGNVYEDSEFLLDNCRILVKNAVNVSGTDIFTIEGYKTAKIVNCPYIMNKRDHYLTITLHRCANIRISDNDEISNVGFMLDNLTASTELVSSTRMDKGVLFSERNKFLETLNGNPPLNFFNFSGADALTKYKIVFRDNLYDTITNSRWLRFSAIPSGEFDITASGLTMRGSMEEMYVPTSKLYKSNNNASSMPGFSVLKEYSGKGKVSVVAGQTDATVTLTGDSIQPDTNYSVICMPAWSAGDFLEVNSAKTTTSFKIAWGKAPTGNTSFVYQIVNLRQ